MSMELAAKRYIYKNDQEIVHASIAEPNKFALVSKAASSVIAVPFSKAAAVKRMNIEASTDIVAKRTKPLLKISGGADKID